MQDFDIEIGGAPGPAGPAGSVADGDKGDIVVSGSGVAWAIDPSVLSTFGRTLTSAASAAAGRAALGLVIGTDVQAYDADLASIAALTTTSFGRGLLTIADGAAMRSSAGLGTIATLDADVDTSLAANSDSKVATQKAVKAYVDQAVAGLLDFKGGIDCSASPNYPAALKGDAYSVSVAGKIGGASGKSVDVGDVVIASADNGGGTEGAVGASWFVLEHNLTGALVASNNLADLTNAATARTNLGLTYFATGTDAANLTGTVSALRLPALTGGDVTSSAGSGALAIGANKVTRGMLAQAAGATILGAAAAGNVTDLTPAQAKTFLAITAADVAAGGSASQVQFNSSGNPGGAASLEVDADGNLRVVASTPTATPAADKVTVSGQKIASGGGRVLPRWRSEDGIYSTLQPHLGRNSIAWAQSPGGSGNALTMSGLAGMTSNVTAAGRTAATTNRATRSRRIGYVSATSAGSFAAFYSTSTGLNWTIGTGTALAGGGFLAVFRFVPADAAAVSGANMFIGMSNSSVAPTATANPNTLTNVIGIAQCNGSSNLQIVYGGSAAQTPIDLGANFPAGGLSTDLYELILYARPDDATKVAYRVERINTGDVASGVLTGTAGTALPASSTFLGPRIYRANNATALAVAVDLVSLTIESDL